MFKRVTPEKAINFTRLSIALNGGWPLPSTATKFQVFRFKIVRCIALLSAFALIFPLFYSMYVNYDNAYILTKVTCFTVAVIHVFGQSTFSIIHYDRIQALVEQMIDYCAKAKSYERSVLQQYVDRFSMFYYVAASWFYVTASIFVVGTLFISQPFPIDAEYPFAVNYEPLRTTIFFHHGYLCMQCAAIVCSNVFAALLLFFAAARFEILMIEMRAVQNVQMLVQCVKKYYRIKSYAQEVVSVIQYTAIFTTIMGTLPLVLCGLNVIGRQPFLIKVQFLFMAGTALLEVFMCAWPADNLLDVSENAVRSIYESVWYTQNAETQKLVLLTIMTQKPITIGMAFVVPVLSLKFYCSYVSNAFSLFTALRLMMDDEAES